MLLWVSDGTGDECVTGIYDYGGGTIYRGNQDSIARRVKPLRACAVIQWERSGASIGDIGDCVRRDVGVTKTGDDKFGVIICDAAVHRCTCATRCWCYGGSGQKKQLRASVLNENRSLGWCSCQIPRSAENL